ncbi:MAG: hypothetical protein RL095_1751 [Verrucomicrobiota bacterium]|jgi:membrane protein involved in colicin uptake
MSRFHVKAPSYIAGRILEPGEYELPDDTPEAPHLLNLDAEAKRQEETKAKAEAAKLKAEKDAEAAKLKAEKDAEAARIKAEKASASKASGAESSN